MSNEWKRNRGRKSLPVPKGTLVDVAHRDGEVYEGVKCGQGGRYAENWEVDGAKGDIVKWRLHEPVVADAPDEQGWVKWEGGKCPVPEGTPIDLTDRDGEIHEGCTALDTWNESRHWEWNGLPRDCDIVAYRLVFPATPLRAPVEAAPTIDQLIQSWRELTDRAAVVQAEADALTAQVNQAADAVTAALAGAGWGVSVVVEPGPDAQIDDDWYLTVKPGDQVECVTIPDEHQGTWFTVGSTYTVGDIDHESPTMQLDVHCNNGFTL